MIVAPGATSVSVDVFFADDTGAAVTGQLATNFPACKWSGGSNTADTTITLSDLAAITTAHPNDNTAGGVKEREGGWYRLDLPNNMISAAGRKTLTFAETTNKRIVAPFIDCQYVQSNLLQILGTTLTETSGQIAAAFKKFFDKSAPTGTINSLADAVPGAAGGGMIAGSNAATTVNITGNLTGNVTGSVGSVAGAVGSVAGQTLANLDVASSTLATATNLAVTDGKVSTVITNLAALFTTALTESYAANGAAPTLAQAIFLIQQTLTEFAISGTTLTIKKKDHSAIAATLTLDSSTAPISATRAT